MTMQDIILLEIKEFNASSKRKLMITGQKYYDVENDILDRQILRYTDEGYEEDKSKANNKLVHAFMKNLVDEKVGYLLSKPFSLDGEKKEYIEKIKTVLGKNLQYEISKMGNEVSNKGLGYWYIYIDEAGNFKYMKMPAEQCIPIWKDNSHSELQAMIRYYIQIVYEGKEKKEVTKVEYYTEDTVEYYVMQENNLIYDIEVEPEGGPVPHYKKGDEGRSWGKVPFVVFKNNDSEHPDIKFVKALIDDYDKRRSDISNILEECKNYITVLKNYGGQDLAEFLRDLNYYRAIKVDDDGGVDVLSPKIDVEAAKLHLEQGKRDIKEFGQSVNMDLDKMGSAPSGIALKFLYSGLDLKCNKLELEFKNSWAQLLFFVDTFLAETGQGNYSNEDVEIVFNRDIAINETEAISNCVNSKDIISDETIIANHPWVKDPEQELERLKKQQEENMKKQQEAFGMGIEQKASGGSDVDE